MPGPAIHHLIAASFARQLREAGFAKFSEAFIDKLTSQYSSAFYLGCQGPDPLFFNTKDWQGAMGSIVEFMIGVHQFTKNVKEKVRGIVPDEIWNMLDTIDEFKDDVERRSVFIGQATALLNESKRLLELLKTMIETKGKEFFFGAIDLFSLVKHPIQDRETFLGGDDPYYGQEVWWWFDLLHYRKTGVYLKTLLDTAPPDSAELAYALGYITHFAGDVTGHPFVNIISGGPYRTHAQRHKLVENYQDAWAWRHYRDAQFVKSNLAQEYNFGYTEELPDDLADYIVAAMNQTYQTPYGDKRSMKGMDRGTMKATYKLWHSWFSMATNVDDLPKPKAFSFTSEVQDAWETFVNNLQDAGELLGSPAGSSGSVWDFFKALFAGILGAILAGLALIDFILGLIVLGTTAPARFMLGVLYEKLYKVYMDFQRGVSCSGLAHPFNVHVDDPLMRHLTHSGIADIRGTTANTGVHQYPFRKYATASIPDGHENHMVYPMAARDGYDHQQQGCVPAPDASYFMEADHTTGAPPSYYAAEASHYIDATNGLQFSEDYFEKLLHASSAKDVAGLDHMLGKLSLGGSVDFSINILRRYLDKGHIPDMNLDADRGYGYRTWLRSMDGSDQHVAVEKDPCFSTHEVLSSNVQFMNPETTAL